MKKFLLVAIAILMTGLLYAQTKPASMKQHVPFVVETRTTPFNAYVNKYTPIYCLADSGVVYIPTRDFSSSSTMNTILASASYYYSFEPAVPFATVTVSGALSAAGAVGFGTSYNKFTVAAATGNTVIAGTLGVTGAATAATLNTGQGANELYDMDQNVLIASDVTFGSVASTDNVIVGTQVRIDTTIYFGSKNGLVWNVFAAFDTVGVNAKMRLENISDIRIQNKAGNGQVEIIERDTTGATAKANLTNIKLATADSARVNRIVISDTLQGLVIYNQAGAKYRLRVSNTGVLAIIAVP